MRVEVCRGRDSNPHGGVPPRDFKSLASTNSATPARPSLIVIPYYFLSLKIFQSLWLLLYHQKFEQILV